MPWPILAVIAAMAYSIRSVIIKRSLKLESALEFCLGFYIIGLIFVLPVLFFLHKFDLSLNQRELGFVVVLLNTAWTVLYYIVLSDPAALVRLVNSLFKISLLITTLIGGLVFKEHDLKQKAFASLLILAGSVAIVI